MTNCTNIQIQEMLPDLLHDSLAPAARKRIETHLADCAECAEELRVLRLVNAAAVFHPAIDAVRIARQIPPYRGVLPATQQPSRNRMVSWLTLASAAVVVALVGGVLTLNNSDAPRAVAVRAVDSTTSPSARLPDTDVAAVPSDIRPTTNSPGSSSHSHALALAADVDGLSDGSLVQLMDDMSAFDGLPSAEPEPVLAVDSGEPGSED
jgi:anti-sigma factor RsiW